MANSCDEIGNLLKMATAAFILNRFLTKFKTIYPFPSTPNLRLKPNRYLLENSKEILNKQKIFSLFSILKNKFQFPMKTTKKVYLSSNGRNSPTEPEEYIQLMKFEEIFWPGIFKHMENILMLDLIMNLRFDPQFTTNKFLYDAKKVIVKVSKHLSKGELDKIQGFVSKEAISEIERNLLKMNTNQRSKLKMKSEDIYLSFIYTFNVAISEQKGIEKRRVEIVCVFHSVTDFQQVKEKHKLNDPHGPPFTFTTILNNAELISIANYSFIRDFSVGVKGEWIVNKLNHFKPSDIPDPYDMFRIY